MPETPFHTILPTDYDLLQRWPDANLSKSFRELLAIYRRLSEDHWKKSGEPSRSLREGYTTICRWIEESSIKTSESRGSTETVSERLAVRSIILDLKTDYKGNWLQSLASLLGMLMHFSVDDQGTDHLVNHRRPKKLFSTYPNSPAVTMFVGDAVASYILKQPIPAICHRFSDAERYAERALAFRALDPSMESGQLLLDLAMAFIRRVHSTHLPSTKTARYLTRALLEKLCRDCLWGIDKNELATGAVALMFSLLGAEAGIASLVPANLFTANALECFNGERLPLFDAIVNNPPWGETLKPDERKRLRGRFSSIKHQSDTYVAFAELAIRSLRPEGAFALVLPSQVVATCNTSRLREMLLSEAGIDQLALLPRSAFAHATVRGLVLLGRAHPALPPGHCHATVYPIVKRFDAIGPARSFTIPCSELQQAGESSWWPLLNTNGALRFRAATLALEQVALVASGVQLYRTGYGIPPQTSDVVRNRSFTFTAPLRGTLPAIQGRDVRDFHVRDPRQFIKFGEWLAHVGDHELLRLSTRIFVRELCRRDGKLTASVARDGFVPLHGVLTVVPKMIDAHALAGILNSAMAAKYVSGHTASFSKVDFQKITVSELRQMPIPIAALDARHRRALSLAPPTEEESSMRRRLAALARKLSRMKPENDSKVEELRLEMNAVVSAMYGLSREDENA